MGMAIDPNLTIEQKYGVKYTDVVARQLQQERSVLEPYVKHVGNCTGKSVQIDITSQSEMQRITSAYQDVKNPIIDTFTCRQMFAVPFYAAHKFTCDARTYSNRLKHAVPNIITEIVSAAGRRKDDVIVGMYEDAEGILRKIKVGSAPASGPYTQQLGGGILGTNYLGETGTYLEDLSEDKSVVHEDFVASGSSIESNMTLDKFREGVGRLKRCRAFVPGKTRAVCLMSDSQLTSLTQQLQVSDPGWGVYNMKEGKLMRLYGVDIVETERLPYMDGTTEVRLCPMFVSEYIYYGLWKELDVHIDGPGNGRVNYGQVVAQMSMGSTRKYLEAVQEIRCVE